jgi:hypothetical protein
METKLYPKGKLPSQILEEIYMVKSVTIFI